MGGVKNPYSFAEKSCLLSTFYYSDDMDSLSSFSDFLTQKLQTISHVSLIAHKNLDGDAVGCLE